MRKPAGAPNPTTTGSAGGTWRRIAAVAGVALLVGVVSSSTTAAVSYGDWSAPVNLGSPVNSSVGESGPALSADGLRLYFFATNKPGGFGANDIWVSRRSAPGASWGAPVNVGPTINTSLGEQFPTLSDDGHWLFYATARPDGLGGQDLYQSYRPDVHDDLGWQTPTNLGPNVNTAGDENAAGYFENGGHPQLFFSSGPLSPTVLDLYVSDRQPDGTWGVARLIPELSTASGEQRPSIRSDGLEMFFHSDRPGTIGGGDLWAATRPSTAAPWSTPVNLVSLNTTANDIHANISADGRTLLWSSPRSGGLGGADLWMATRAAKLTVTGNDQSRLFGQANPPLTYELSGFVGGETSAVASGTAACSTTATPSSPGGEYPITCSRGSLSAPGYAFDSFVASTLTVTYSRPCLTAPSVGPLHVAAGDAVCLSGIQAGPVTVAPGGSLDVEGGRVTGPVVASGAAAVRICGAAITGPLTVNGTTGPVLVGGEGCDPNTIVGPVRVTDNTGGVEVNGNTVVGPLRVIGNAAPVHAAGNTVTGPVVIQP